MILQSEVFFLNMKIGIYIALQRYDNINEYIYIQLNIELAYLDTCSHQEKVKREKYTNTNTIYLQYSIY